MQDANSYKLPITNFYKQVFNLGSQASWSRTIFVAL